MFTNVNSMHYVHTIMINFNMRSLACIYVYASLDDQQSRWRLDRTQWIILFPVVSPFIQKFSRMSQKICNSFFSNFHTKFNDNRRSYYQNQVKILKSLQCFDKKTYAWNPDNI